MLFSPELNFAVWTTLPALCAAATGKHAFAPWKPSDQYVNYSFDIDPLAAHNPLSIGAGL
jgi:hypothetical protein